MDPSCGGGTFLVRAYARKSVLNPALDHSDLLESIYGCDVLNYACHLSLINLAIRDLIDDDNFPRIHLGDFLALRPGSVFDHQPVRIHAGGLVTETREINICENEFNAIVGNPPYIQSREMSAQARRSYFDAISREWPLYQWSRASDIYVYFWIHAERFLQENGYLGFLTQAAWLDVEYGIPLQLWMLDNFRVVAVLETEAEPWFTGARVATAVTVLQRENNEEARRNNLVGFVQFRRRLSEIVGLSDTEEARQTSFAALRDEILELGNRKMKIIEFELFHSNNCLSPDLTAEPTLAASGAAICVQLIPFTNFKLDLQIDLSNYKTLRQFSAGSQLIAIASSL